MLELARRAFDRPCKVRVWRVWALLAKFVRARRIRRTRIALDLWKNFMIAGRPKRRWIKLLRGIQLLQIRRVKHAWESWSHSVLMERLTKHNLKSKFLRHWRQYVLACSHDVRSCQSRHVKHWCRYVLAERHRSRASQVQHLKNWKHITFVNRRLHHFRMNQVMRTWKHKVQQHQQSKEDEATLKAIFFHQRFRMKRAVLQWSHYARARRQRCTALIVARAHWMTRSMSFSLIHWRSFVSHSIARRHLELVSFDCCAKRILRRCIFLWKVALSENVKSIRADVLRRKLLLRRCFHALRVQACIGAAEGVAIRFSIRQRMKHAIALWKQHTVKCANRREQERLSRRHRYLTVIGRVTTQWKVAIIVSHARKTQALCHDRLRLLGKSLLAWHQLLDKYCFSHRHHVQRTLRFVFDGIRVSTLAWRKIRLHDERAADGMAIDLLRKNLPSMLIAWTNVARAARFNRCLQVRRTFFQWKRMCVAKKMLRTGLRCWFRHWECRLHESRIFRRQTAAALCQWSTSLLKRCLVAWHHQSRQRSQKLQVYQKAFEMHQLDILKDAVRRWILAANAQRSFRRIEAIHNSGRLAEKVWHQVTRIALFWRAKTLARRSGRLPPAPLLQNVPGTQKMPREKVLSDLKISQIGPTLIRRPRAPPRQFSDFGVCELLMGRRINNEGKQASRESHENGVTSPNVQIDFENIAPAQPKSIVEELDEIELTLMHHRDLQVQYKKNFAAREKLRAELESASGSGRNMCDAQLSLLERLCETYERYRAAHLPYLQALHRKVKELQHLQMAQHKQAN